MTRNKLPLFSVIICSYNGAAVIGDCLKALKKQSWGRRIEIIVVDDNSSDNTATIAQSFKGVRVKRNPHNMGPAASRNVGINMASGDIIAFTDDDCRPSPSWIRELWKGYSSDSIVGVGGNTAPHNNTTLLYRYLANNNPLDPLEVSTYVKRSPSQRLLGYIKGVFGNSTPRNTLRIVYSLPSANLSFRRETLEKVNGFDESFTFSGEDQDLCRRVNAIHENGIMYAPRAKVRHQYKNSLRDTLRRSKAYGKGNALFGQKHPDVKPVIFPFPIILALASLLSLLVNPLWLIACIAVVPLLYFRWIRLAASRRAPEPLAYAYIQFLQEVYGNIGFVKGFAQRSVSKKSLINNTLRTTSKIKISNQFYITLAIIVIFNGLIAWSSPLQLTASALASLYIPGYLMLLALNIRVTSVRLILLAIGLSGASLIGLGMLVNLVASLPNSPVTLTTPFFMIALDLFFLILLLVTYKKLINSPDVRLPGFSFIRVLGVMLLAALPFASSAAASVLNNTGNNQLSMLMVAIFVVVMGGLLVYGKKLNNAWIAAIIYVLGLSVILLGSMRGDVVSGTDISKELYLLNLMQSAGHWSPSLYADAYNASLSINIFPTILAELFRLSNDTIFRVVIPALYAFVPLMAYSLLRGYRSKIFGVLGAILVIAQPSFVTWSPVPIRQMVAIFFFTALILVAFDKKLSRRPKNIFIFILGLGVILSHYSTAYLSLGVLMAAYGIHMTLGYLRQRKIKNETSISTNLLISPRVLLALIIAAIVWYGPVTHAGSNITGRVHKAWNTIVSGNFSFDSKSSYAAGTSPAYQLGLESKTQTKEELMSDYLNKTQEKYDSLHITPLQTTSASSAQPVENERLPERAPTGVVTTTTLLDRILRQLVRVGLVIGLVLIAWRLIKRSEIDQWALYGVAAGIALALVVVVPHASIDYDVGRATQHLLILLVIPILLGAEAAVRFIGRSHVSEKTIVSSIGGMVMLLMLFTTGFATQLSGGAEPTMLLNNSGNQYNQIYVHAEDIASAEWLKQNQNNHNLIYSGYFSGTRFYHAGLERPVVYNDILPWTIDQQAYVYRGYSEVKNDEATTYINGAFLNYQYPSEILGNTKDVTYTNGRSIIYK